MEQNSLQQVSRRNFMKGALCGGAIAGGGTKMQAEAGIEGDTGDALLRDTQASLEALYGPDLVEYIGDDWRKKIYTLAQSNVKASNKLNFCWTLTSERLAGGYLAAL